MKHCFIYLLSFKGVRALSVFLYFSTHANRFELNYIPAIYKFLISVHFNECQIFYSSLPFSDLYSEMLHSYRIYLKSISKKILREFKIQLRSLESHIFCLCFIEITKT